MNKKLEEQNEKLRKLLKQNHEFMKILLDRTLSTIDKEIYKEEIEIIQKINEKLTNDFNEILTTETETK